MNRRTRDDPNTLLRLLLLAGVLVALALRVFHLGAESLWYDETVSAYLSSRQPLEIIRHTAGDIHPPGYYLMLRGWRNIVHPALNNGLEYLLGWSSVAWGMLAIALLYPLGRRLLNSRSAVLAVWLAAINPYQIWYGQEVRMYTMGAALGLLCLWAALAWRDSSNHRWVLLGLYATGAAVGLYTLYYFALLLVAINLIVLLLVFLNRSSNSENLARSVLLWLSAQILVLVLYSPWMPTLWKQATNPPVPPWRMPWHGAAEIIGSITESVSVLLVGQAPPFAVAWPWALPAIAATVIFVVWPTPASTAHEGESVHRPREARITLLTYVFLPVALLFSITLLVTPVYHVRYLFTYAPPFMLIVAASVSALWTIQRWLGAGWLVLICGISLAGTHQAWFNPIYRADDHRTAVADLAENWRPGDLILVNAGWVYTALDTYWPTELAGPRGSTPPPLAPIRRLHEMPDPPIRQQPNVAVTGSVDGDANLGWGDPESDFFALSQAQTNTALDQLDQDYARIWHYRIYDTVNDPESIIRDRLAENGEVVLETAYPGRDFLLVQMFESRQRESRYTDEISPDASVDFGGAIRLTNTILPSDVRAGDTLYVELEWLALPQLSALETDLSMSIRLYDSDTNLVAQADSPPLPATGVWQPDDFVRQPLALALPVSLKPGPHSLELVVYRQDDGMPLTLPDDARTVLGQRRQLGVIEVLHAQTAPILYDRLARFDFIDLVEATVRPPIISSGDQIRLDLIWRPRPNSYRDNYLATVELRTVNGDVVATWTEPLGGSGYPSGQWPTGLPVMETRWLNVPASMSPGEYSLTVRVERSSDGRPIKAGTNRLPIPYDYATISEVTVE